MIRTRGTFTWIAAVSLSYGEYLAFNLRVWGLLQRYGRERQLRLMIQILPTPNAAKSDPSEPRSVKLFQYVVMLVYYTINTRGQLTTLTHQPYYCRSGNGNTGFR